MMHSFGIKQPAEEFFVEFDFTNDLGSTEIDSADIVIIDLADAEETDVVDTISDPNKQANSGQSAFVWVRAGTDGHSYKITCTVTGTDDSIYELEGVLPVIDK